MFPAHSPANFFIRDLRATSSTRSPPGRRSPRQIGRLPRRATEGNGVRRRKLQRYAHLSRMNDRLAGVATRLRTRRSTMSWLLLVDGIPRERVDLRESPRHCSRPRTLLVLRGVTAKCASTSMGRCAFAISAASPVSLAVLVSQTRSVSTIRLRFGDSQLNRPINEFPSGRKL